MLELVISNLIGLTFGLAVAWWFSRGASRELENWVTILARFLESFAEQALPGSSAAVSFSRDPKGRITNANVTIKGSTAGAVAKATEGTLEQP